MNQSQAGIRSAAVRLARCLVRLALARPRQVLGVAGAIFLLLGAAIPRVKLELDAHALLYSEPAYREADASARALFKLGDTVVIGVQNRSGDIFDPTSLGVIARLSRTMESIAGIAPGSVQSISTVPGSLIVDNRLVAAPILGPERAAAGASVRADVEAFGFDDGLLVSRDHRMAVIYAEVEERAERRPLLRQIREAIAAEAGDTHQIHLSGTALAQAVLGNASARDLAVLLPFVIVVMALVLWLRFRSFLPVLVSLTEVLFSVICTAGVMGVMGERIFITALVLPVVVITIGVSDDLYALELVFAGGMNLSEQTWRDRVRAALEEVAPQIMVTSALSVVGLLSFGLNALDPIRVFGIFGAVAIGISTLCTFTVVPAMLVAWGASFREKEPETPSQFRLPMATPRRSTSFWAVVALLLVGAVYASVGRRININDSWISNLPEASDVRRGDDALNEMMAGTIILHFLVENSGRQTFNDPAPLERLGELERIALAQPGVGATHSVRTELGRTLAALNEQRFNPVPAANIGAEWNASMIAQAYLILASGPNFDLARWIDGKGRRARLTVFLKHGDYRKIEAIVTALTAAGARSELRLVPFGDAWLSYQTVHFLVDGQIQSVLVAMGIDFMILLLVLRSLRFALCTLVPVLAAMAVVFASMAILDVPLGIANSLFTAVALGIGFDFAVHLSAKVLRLIRDGFVESQAMAAAYESVAPAILTGAVSISSGLGLLWLSEIAPNAELGILMAAALLLCCLFTLTLTPLMLRLSRWGLGDVPPDRFASHLQREVVTDTCSHRRQIVDGIQYPTAR